MCRFRWVALASLLFVQPALAGSSADQMFSELSKEFGAVPRGPTLEHTFHVRNSSTEVVRIARLRVSCGCTTAFAQKSVLNPGEATTIVARLDTTRFSGDKTYTVFVDLDQPRLDEVRLTLRANARDDFSMTPSTLALGLLKRGDNQTATVRLTFRTGDGLRVQTAQAESNYVLPEIREVSRQFGEVVYDLTAKVRPDTPVGKWFTDVWVTTNNEITPRVRVPLTVEIESALTVSPAVVQLSDIKLGATSERKVVIRGTKPFKIQAIRGTDSSLSAREDNGDSKLVHVVTITGRGQVVGELQRTLEVQTDLEVDNRISFSTTGKIVP